ncbi:Transcription factor TEOSINTE BRANCHED 1 [Spatholobus suberectus]|nr:Transcription factor TEOSINTE BRANCHED 1 [Spatholobus suberectus]
MYSSNTSLNSNDLISYPNQAFCFRPFSFESNPTNSTKEAANSNYALPPPPPPLSFFQSPYEENIFLEHHHDLLLLHQSLADPGLAKNLDVVAEISPIPCPGHGATTMKHTPRKRSSKRDRHSKINTARGLRDRRMRLSLEVAKRFFGLQDMLGFDKASKTVDWLLNQAKVEIKQLAREKSSVIGGAKSASSTSECEGVSSLDEVVVSGVLNNEEQAREPHVKRRTSKVCRKSAFNPIDKESREKARERARERTREKMRTRRLADASNLNRLSSWNPFETVEDSACTQSQSVNHPSLDVHLTEAEEPSSHAKEHLGQVEDMAHEDNSLVIMSKWSPTMMFNSLNSSGILQEHQFAEFQSLGKPWEAYNNHI